MGSGIAQQRGRLTKYAGPERWGEKNPDKIWILELCVGYWIFVFSPSSLLFLAFPPLLRSGEILTGPGINFEHLPMLDEDGNVDLQTGLQLHRLADVGGAVPLYPVRGFYHL